MPNPEMPASEAYRQRGAEPESVRDRFAREYGSATVSAAELQVCIDILILTGVIKPQEFVEVLERKLKRVDRMRRLQAGVSEG